MDEKIIISEDNELGHSYYIYDDDYYYYDDDYYEDDDYYYYDDDYSESYYSSYSYPSYYSSSYYYPGYSSYYYPYSYYYDDYYRYRYDDYYYYDDYRRRENKENRLTINGDTLRVGSNYDNDIWLNNASGSYANVRVIDAEHNNHNLFIAGNSRNNSIIGGNGNPTLWGGGGSSNTLIGGAKRDVFFYEGGSRDVAKNFGTGDSDYSDVVNFSNVTWSSINRDSASITFNMADGNYMQLQPGSSYDEDPILFSGNGRDIYKMKIAQNTSTNLNYRDDIKTFYFSNPGQLIVSGSGNNIWLGGESGQNYYNVTTINGGSSSGYNTLMGSADPNVIYGGSGVSTLWGGTGVATDTLIGGEGPETFRCGKNEGSDIVYTNQGHDVISLYDVNLSDITSAEVVGEVVAIGFNTGTFLNVHNTAEVTSIFQLSDGKRYNYNRSTNQWQGA